MVRSTWTIVWGWTQSGPSVWREQFVDKRLCWERVQVLMGVLEEGVTEGRLPILQVWSGGDVTTFRQYAEGSRFCQWGRWGAYTMKVAERAGG